MTRGSHQFMIETIKSTGGSFESIFIGSSPKGAAWHACTATKWNNRAGERILRSGASLETPRRMHLHSSTLLLLLPLSLSLSLSLPFPTPLLASPWQEISMQPGVLIDGEQCSRPQRLLREPRSLSFSRLYLCHPLSPDEPAPFYRSLQLDRTPFF